MTNNIFYVYILHCADDSFYTGVTNSLQRRMEEHNSGIIETAYTYDRRPLKLVYHEIYRYVNEAIAREKQIKNWSRAKKIALMRGEIKKLKELSRCTNESSHANFEYDKGDVAARTCQTERSRGDK